MEHFMTEGLLIALTFPPPEELFWEVTFKTERLVILV